MSLQGAANFLLRLPSVLLSMPIRRVVSHYPPPVVDVIREFQGRFPAPELGVNEGFEWNRIAFAAGLAKGTSVLDVGAGNGALLNMLSRGGAMTRVFGIDIRRKAMRNLDPGIDFAIMDVTRLKFRDGEFDTVMCMEVIEHLAPETVDLALAQLRRVAKRRLLVTVPYREADPLFHHDRPTGHKQTFDDDKLRRLFPTGVMTLLPRGRWDWVLIAEDADHRGQAFPLLTMADFSRLFGVIPAADQFIVHALQLVRRRFPARERIRTAIRPWASWLGLVPKR